MEGAYGSTSFFVAVLCSKVGSGVGEGVQVRSLLYDATEVIERFVFAVIDHGKYFRAK